jgi:hypothetical protein
MLIRRTVRLRSRWERCIARRAAAGHGARHRPLGAEDRAEAPAALARWRAALDQVERAIHAETMGGDGGDQG